MVLITLFPLTDAYAQTTVITELLVPSRATQTIWSDDFRQTVSPINCQTSISGSSTLIVRDTVEYRLFIHPNSGSGRCILLIMTYDSDLNIARGYDIISANIKFSSLSLTEPPSPIGSTFCKTSIHPSDLSLTTLAFDITDESYTSTLPYYICTRDLSFTAHDFNIPSTSPILTTIQQSRADPAQNGKFILAFSFNDGANFIHARPQYVTGFDPNPTYKVRLGTSPNTIPTVTITYERPLVESLFPSTSYANFYTTTTTDLNSDCADTNYLHENQRLTITSGVPSNCQTLAFEIDDVAIPLLANITDVTLDFTTTFSNPSPSSCHIRLASSNLTNAQQYIQARNQTQPSISFPCTAGDHSITLSTGLKEQLQFISSDFTNTENPVFLFTVYVNNTPEFLEVDFINPITLKLSHPVSRLPPIFDLQGYSTNINGINLLWSPPPLFGHEIIGYQIYRGINEYPDTLIATTTTPSYFDVDPTLTADNFYQYYVITLTRDKSNSDPSNILKIQTLQNLRIGSLEFTHELQPEASVLFQSVADAGYTNVTLSRLTDIELTCRYYTTTGLENSTLSLAPTTINNRLVDEFIFEGIDNDSVEIICKDDDGNRYSHPVTQGTENTIPIVKALQQFSDGTFKTQGYVGSIDLVFIGIIFLSFIGFNRVNPVLGVLTSTAIIFFAAWMGLLQVLPATITLIVLIIVTALVVTKK